MRSYVGCLIAILLIFRCVFCQSNQISYNAPCRRHDPQLNSCLARAFDNSKNALASGDWMLGIKLKSMDPFNLQNHIFGSDESLIKVITNNMTVNGLSNFKIQKYNVSLDALSADLTLFYPKIADTGEYTGFLNPLGVSFQGKFRSWYRNTRAFIHFEAEKHFRDGVEYLRLVDVTLSSDKKFIALKSSHRVHDIAIPILYPYIERTYAEIIRDEMNKIADAIPYDMLLPE